jgi:anti-anti-sigma factor
MFVSVNSPFSALSSISAHSLLFLSFVSQRLGIDMTAEVLTKGNNNETILKLNGEFRFDFFSDFRKISQELIRASEQTILDIDFTHVSNIDTTGLGMLLWFKESCDLANKQLKLINVGGLVAEILKSFNFKKYISIQYRSDSGIYLDADDIRQKDSS